MELVAYLVVMPLGYLGAVLIHELLHAAAAMLLGQTVTRVLVGEGRVLMRIGRDPQLVLGSVIWGNGVTHVMDLRRRGYKLRTIIMSLAAPISSLLVGIGAWQLAGEREFPARTALNIVAFLNLFIAFITLIPFPTLGGTVWSDLAAALFTARADEAQIVEQMLQGAQNRVVLLCEAGETERALAAARASASLAPASAQAACVLAYALWQARKNTEAAAVARNTLAGEVGDAHRDYLARFMADEPTAAIAPPP